MIRYAQPDRILAAGDDIRYMLAARRISVSGPGQNRLASSLADWGTSRAQ